MAKGPEFFVRVDTDDDGKPETIEFVSRIPGDADAVVCVGVTVPLLWPDNMLGRCAACDCPIQFRPISATVAAPKICMDCAADWAKPKQ